MVFFRASVKTVARNEMEGDSNPRMLTLQIQLLIRKVKLKWVFFRASVKTVARNEMEGDSNPRMLTLQIQLLIRKVKLKTV